MESLWLHHIPEFLSTFAKRDLQDRAVKETNLKPLPDCLPSVCHTLQHLGHLFCGPPGGCEMEHLCGLTWIFRRLVVMRISKEQTFV